MKVKTSIQPPLPQELHDMPMAETEVIEFLKAHPDIFCRHEDLLSDMQIPHRAGSAVSLVERQVALLRERNIDMRHRLARIVETARDNDHLFGKTRQLVLHLLEQQTAEELFECVRNELRRETGADFCRIMLFPEADISPETTAASASLKSLFKHNRSLCGPLRNAERQQLFGADADAVECAAVVPMLSEQRVIGALALGSSDPDYFHAEMGTLFLDFVADVMVRRLAECRQD